MNLDTCWV